MANSVTRMRFSACLLCSIAKFQSIARLRSVGEHCPGGKKGVDEKIAGGVGDFWTGERKQGDGSGAGGGVAELIGFSEQPLSCNF